jgi:hypothetical protein
MRVYFQTLNLNWFFALRDFISGFFQGRFAVSALTAAQIEE